MVEAQRSHNVSAGLKRQLLSLLPLAGLFVADRLPPSPFSAILRYSSLTAFVIGLVLQICAGYQRRRLYWTRESWRRYLIASSIPVAALLIFAAGEVAFELRLPIVGAARSTTRELWIAGMVLLMLIGAAGLGGMVSWLAVGDASRQFEWPPWLRRPRGSVE
jgi:hypothetical protein